jgi:hypothetical protein
MVLRMVVYLKGRREIEVNRELIQLSGTGIVSLRLMTVSLEALTWKI